MFKFELVPILQKSRIVPYLTMTTGPTFFSRIHRCAAALNLASEASSANQIVGSCGDH
jgi:hypothetical protein